MNSLDITRPHCFSEVRQLDRLLIQQYPSVSDSVSHCTHMCACTSPNNLAPLFYTSSTFLNTSHFPSPFTHLALSPISPSHHLTISLLLLSLTLSLPLSPPHSISPVSASPSTLIFSSHPCLPFILSCLVDSPVSLLSSQ